MNTKIQKKKRVDMRKFCAVAVISLSIVVVLLGSGITGETGHYVNGVEGLKAATLPPPGLYYRMYNVFYNADTVTDKDGNELNINFDVRVYALVNRLIWITDRQLFGGDYFMDIVIPLIYTDLDIGALGVDSSEFGLGDINIEPFGLSWHGPRYDAAVGLSFYIPTGDYDRTEPASPGKDMWTTMFTLGGTYYLDTDKTWSASILARYEIHGEKDDTNITPGDDFHFEWGVGKTLNRVWDVGLTGYCQWQMSKDSGFMASPDKDQVYAVGPEVNHFIPSVKLFVSFRYQWEFEAEDRSEGSIGTLTFTKIF